MESELIHDVSDTLVWIHATLRYSVCGLIVGMLVAGLF
jgi:hypothetical protein